MADVVVSMDEMKKRYAKFSDLNPSKQAFVDTRLPEHERDIFNVIGEGVTEDPELKPAISAVCCSSSLSSVACGAASRTGCASARLNGAATDNGAARGGS